MHRVGSMALQLVSFAIAAALLPRFEGRRQKASSTRRLSDEIIQARLNNDAASSPGYSLWKQNAICDNRAGNLDAPSIVASSLEACAENVREDPKFKRGECGPIFLHHSNGLCDCVRIKDGPYCKLRNTTRSNIYMFHDQAPFVLAAGPGSPSCPTNSSRITKACVCEKGATDFGLTFQSASWLPGHPSGCFVKGDHVYFNVKGTSSDDDSEEAMEMCSRRSFQQCPTLTGPTPAPTPSPKTKAISLGCRMLDPRGLPKLAMRTGATPHSCSIACKGYKYMGLHLGERCRCGNKRDSLGERDSRCRYECSADPNYICGGSGVKHLIFSSVYELKG